MVAMNKAALRAQLLRARRQITGDLHAAEARLLSAHLRGIVAADSIVCAYAPVGTEPGSIELLDVLLHSAKRVLLPIARTTDDSVPLPLRWSQYRPDCLTGAPFGLREPPEPWLPATALAQARLILVPALAVDRRGARLGRGRGFYDRSLVHKNPRALLIAVVRDEELVDELPSEPHDVAMTHVLTPQRGVIALPLTNTVA
ncbi:MAG: 5-formyltetrahydrofolate cyclo-ligase [Mycobacteriaceae bacterium]|nr:5-formyltetrahydrofolate cyclo-ligase [Mycobacteriaceae bacterium]